jgi:enolase
MQLTNVVARKILNSRKEATIEVVIEANKVRVFASAPSGKSKGKYEVQDVSTRGIDFSITFLNELGRKLVNEKIEFESFEDLSKVEELIKDYDHTPKLEFVGGNALYAIEAAILKAIAASHGVELWKFLLGGKKVVMPRPLGNCIGGGMHVQQAMKTDFQEFLLIPNAKKFFDCNFAMQLAYKEAQKILKQKDYEWKGSLTDENAYAATLDNESVFELLNELREKIKEQLDVELDIGIDAAASSFWKANLYRYKNFAKGEREKNVGEEEQINYLAEIIKKYNLAYVEDPLNQEAFNAFAKLRPKTNALICGDDLTCTHLDRAVKAVKNRSVNAMIIKPNQIGSLLETKKVVDFAKQNDILCVISHRSGETEDDFIADLCVGWQIPMIKTGIIGKERAAKLNRLLKIEKDL